MLAAPTLRARLENLDERYRRGFLDSDPVGIVRRYEAPADREIAGLLAAGLAYGRVRSIRQSVDRLLGLIGPAPSRFVDAFEPSRDARRFDGFVHRFTKGRDIALLLWLVRQAREEAGGLEALFLREDPDPGAATIGPALEAFGRRLFSSDARPFHADGRVPARSGTRWLLPLPSGGSACKRSCLFLRWMVRPDDGVDLGLWRGVPASRLVLPLDVHLQRVARCLGWTRRRNADWTMAQDVTARLRELDPADPTRWDFALSRLGILGVVSPVNGRMRRRDLEAALAGRGRGRER